METGEGIEPSHRGFADPSVSTSPSGQPTSRIISRKFILGSGNGNSLFDQSVRIAPFIIVPGKDFDQVPVDNLS